MHAQFFTMRYPSTYKSNLRVFKREPSRVYSLGLLISGIDCMRVHHEQITNQLFQSVVNNPCNKIHSLLPKKCSNPAYNLRRHKVFDLHKTKTKRFADTFINKSSFVTYSLHFKSFFYAGCPEGITR